MLSGLILNNLDVVNIIYLWTILNRKNNEKFKLIFAIIIITILTAGVQMLNLRLSFIFEYAVSIIAIRIIYKNDLKDIVLSFLLVQLVNMILQLILTPVVENLFQSRMWIGELIILFCMVIFSKTNFGRNLSIKGMDNNITKSDSNVIIYLGLIFIIYATVCKIIWDYNNLIILDNLFTTVVILTGLVISQVCTYLYVVKLAKEKLKLKVSSEYNEVINEIVQEIKQRQHDFINYKNTIKGIVNVVDEKDIKEAIINYIKDEDEYGDKINDLVYIENVVIKSIIYRNMCRFKKYNVNFVYQIENRVLDNILSYNEISNVLNNLLNNAFEEVIKQECMNKNIEVKIFKENKSVHLLIKNQVVNANNIDINEIFTRGYSTKDKCSRGYGLHNVQTIVNLHKGYIKVNLEAGEIAFDVFFNTPA